MACHPSTTQCLVSSSYTGCECLSANTYLRTSPAPQECLPITCAIAAQDTDRHIEYPTDVVVAGVPVTGACMAGYYAAALPTVSCKGQTAQPYTSTTATGTPQHPPACASCDTCAAGNECAGGFCTACPADAFSTAAASPACTACDAIPGILPGSASTNGLVGQTTCSCRAGGTATATGGYYNTNGQQEAALQCAACPDGSYQPAFAGNPVTTSCTCIRNYYSTALGTATAEAPCKPCPALSTTINAQGELITGAITCTCIKGGSPFEAGGAFSNGLIGDDVVCTACPAHSYQPVAGGTTCVCLAGYYSNNKTGADLICTPCPIG